MRWIEHSAACAANHVPFQQYMGHVSLSVTFRERACWHWLARSCIDSHGYARATVASHGLPACHLSRSMACQHGDGAILRDSASSGRICTNLHEFARICTNLHDFAREHTILRNGERSRTDNFASLGRIASASHPTRPTWKPVSGCRRSSDLCSVCTGSVDVSDRKSAA